jgi:Zn-finger nucleic acid-binding protein
MTYICPRCSTELNEVEAHEAGLAPIGHLCPNCEGVWIGTGTLDALSRLPVEGLDQSSFKPTLEADHPDVDLSKPINCPLCSKKLERYVFCSDSGVVVDRCLEHGLWLDDGELGQVLKYLKQGDQLLDELAREFTPPPRERGLLSGIRKLFFGK